MKPMKLTLLFCALMSITTSMAQWSGTYYGTVNGDNVMMTLKQVENSVTGTMKDSYQHFDISGTVSGETFTGIATEHSLQLEFQLNALKKGDLLDCKLSIEVLGNTSETPFTVQKEAEKSNESIAKSTAVTSAIPFPSGATFPSALVGKWTQNESYNSGSGDNFMGANFSQSMTFYNDGTLSEGGSSASMSGSNYSNQSSGGGSGKLDGVGWYAKQKNFYLIVFNNGAWQSVHVGTWYAENNHLLITSTNGEKLLLSK